MVLGSPAVVCSVVLLVAGVVVMGALECGDSGVGGYVCRRDVWGEVYFTRAGFSEAVGGCGDGVYWGDVGFGSGVRKREFRSNGRLAQVFSIQNK